MLLEITFLATLANPWSVNLGTRLVKAPKVYLNDTGLMISLLRLNGRQLAANRRLLGPLLENFVVMELRKQAGWSKTRPRVLHFRTHTGEEVDVVLKTAAGEVEGIEVSCCFGHGIRFQRPARGSDSSVVAVITPARTASGIGAPGGNRFYTLR